MTKKKDKAPTIKYEEDIDIYNSHNIIYVVIQGRRGKQSFYDPKKFPKLIKNLACKGFTNREMAKVLGVSEQRFYVYLEKFPEFKEALRIGRIPVNEEVEASLFNSAKGFFVTEEFIETRLDDKGKEYTIKRVTKKYIPPSTTAQKFWLTNKNKKDWRTENNIDITTQGQQITLPTINISVDADTE